MCLPACMLITNHVTCRKLPRASDSICSADSRTIAILKHTYTVRQQQVSRTVYKYILYSTYSDSGPYTHSYNTWQGYTCTWRQVSCASHVHMYLNDTLTCKNQTWIIINLKLRTRWNYHATLIKRVYMVLTQTLLSQTMLSTYESKATQHLAYMHACVLIKQIVCFTHNLYWKIL